MKGKLIGCRFPLSKTKGPIISKAIVRYGATLFYGSEAERLNTFERKEDHAAEWVLWKCRCKTVEKGKKTIMVYCGRCLRFMYWEPIDMVA